MYISGGRLCRDNNGFLGSRLLSASGRHLRMYRGHVGVRYVCFNVETLSISFRDLRGNSRMTTLIKQNSITNKKTRVMYIILLLILAFLLT